MDVRLKTPAYDLLEDEFLPLEPTDSKGDDIQKLSVVQALPQLLQSEPHATYARVIPKILQELPTSSCEFHVMTSKVFRSLMERQVPINLLHAVLQGIESRDIIVANSWMETLLSIIGVLSLTQLKNEIIPLANSKSLLSQPISSRVACCKILGRLAIHKSLDPMDVKRDILPLTQSLCQDCHPDVRAAMCVQLPLVAQGLGALVVKSNLLTSLVELASDENVSVRSAAVTATVQIFPFTSMEMKKVTLLPLVRQLCEKSMKLDDLAATAVSKEIGKLVEGLQLVFTLSDSVWFLQCYRTLAQKGLSSQNHELRFKDAATGVMCRQNCAYSMPSMATFTLAVVPGQVDMLYQTFRDLAADPCYIVRCAIAGCINEVIKMFGSQNKMLKPDFVRLLRDDSEEVLQMLVPHIGTSLEQLCLHGTISRFTANAATMEVGRALLKCQYELTNGYNWRLLGHFIHQLEHLPNCMPADYIHQHFTPPVLSNAVQGRAKPVRTQAARTLLVFLRYNSKEMQRKWLRDNMISQLCFSKNCYTRHIFVRMCTNAMEIFSEKYFKSYFFENLLDLADDPVANIRLCVVSLFPALKQMLILPEDQALNDRLNEVFGRFLMEEKDRDVIETFKRSMEEIRKPMPSSMRDAHDKEEKQRQDEEERIVTGLKASSYAGVKKAPPKPLRPGSTAKTSPRDSSFARTNSASARSTSVPPKPAPTPYPSSDMNFLEQHFYIDAGISLPTAPSVDESKPAGSDKVADATCALSKVDINVEGVSPNLSQLSGNITDDDKVNLRKLSGCKSSADSRAADKKSKRYSSIFSSTCMEKAQERKAINRRSLNIPVRDASKIPVSLKGIPKKERSAVEEKSVKKEYQNNNDGNKWICNDIESQCTKNDALLSGDYRNDMLSLESNNSNDNYKNSFKATSHLPVLKRRSVSEARKPF